MYASISADIITSTSLPNEDWSVLVSEIKDLFIRLENRYSGLWCRLVRGDTIECICDCPNDAFEIALILKCFVKVNSPSKTYTFSKTFRRGLKIAIGIGTMNIIDRKLDIMDGDAIYRSGRALNENSGWSQYAFNLCMQDKIVQEPCQLIFSLINHDINSATPRQCETLYHRLMLGNEQLVKEEMGITLQGVYKNLSAIGWTNIEKAIHYFRSIKLQ